MRAFIGELARNLSRGIAQAPLEKRIHNELFSRMHLHKVHHIPIPEPSQ